MYQFEDLSSLEPKLSQQRASRQQQFQALLEEAQLAFADFQQGFDKTDLADLTDICLEAIQLQRQRVEPYAYLAYAMFCVSAHQLGVKYLKIARELQADYFLVRTLQKQLKGA